MEARSDRKADAQSAWGCTAKLYMSKIRKTAKLSARSEKKAVSTKAMKEINAIGCNYPEKSRKDISK